MLHPPPRNKLRGSLGRITLRGKLVTLMVGIFAAFIWGLAWFSVTVLQNQLEAILSEQQLSAVRQVAAELDSKLKDRILSLTSAATHLPTDMNPVVLERYLERLAVPQGYFSGGMAVIPLDGRTLSDFPVAPGRRGTYFGDRDYFRAVVATGKPFVDKPIMGRALKRPVLTISVPAFDDAGRVRAVVTGITDLTAPSFLGVISDPALTGSGEFFAISLRDRIIVAATDSSRVLTDAPARGSNPIYDRMVDGFEGSGVGVNGQGQHKLYSGTRATVVDWLIVAALPAEVAFRPAILMRQYVFAVAVALTVLAIAVVLWLVRRTMAPLVDTARAMQWMTRGQAEFTELPVDRDDEVGRMLTSFNLLVGERRRYECRLKDEEEVLRQTVVELERSNAELERLAYVASHDLQEPVRTVVSFSQMLSRELGPAMSPTSRECLDYIVGGARRMHDLVNDLLEYSRVTRGERPSEPVDCNAAFAAATSNLAALIRETGATVRATPLPTVIGDGTQIVTLFQNLFANAIKFARPGVAATVEVTAACQGGEWMISVADNGIGILRDYWDDIFVIFRRLHPAEVYPGTGLGLALCKRIVERQGGRIWLESEVDKGSTFFFTLPKAEKVTPSADRK